MCKITAPELEPQRGTVIQTDDSGRIATMPTDDGKSRIISRDEYDRLNTPQGRSASEARAEMGFGREQDLARQASRGIAEFGPPSARANVPDVMGGFRQGDVTVSQAAPVDQATGIDLFRDMDAQRARDFEKQNVLTPATLPSESELLDMTADYQRAFFQPESNRGINRAGNPRQRKIYSLVNKFLKDDPELAENYPDNVFELLDFATDQVNKEEYLANLQAYSPRGENKLSTTSGFEQPYSSDFDQDPQFPESSTFGARLKNPNELFQEENRSQADLSQLRSKTSGIPSLNRGSQDVSALYRPAGSPPPAPELLDEGFMASQKSMFAPLVNKLGEFMGFKKPYDLYQATQAQVERSKQADAMRRRDQDRAMQSQAKQPFDPCPPGYKYDPAQRQCVPVAKEEAETEMGQKFVRNPVPFAGDPNMYGRTGGEYQFFTEVPGLIKAANGIPRGPTGEIRGAGGPKDDLVGPFMLSDQEYVLPKEMVMAAGGGNYDTGIKKLENMRKDSLNKYGDYV